MSNILYIINFVCFIKIGIRELDFNFLFYYTVASILGILLYLYKCWRRQWHPTPVLLPGKSHGRRSLVGCGPWGRWGLDMTEQLHFHFSLSCIGEGNGNPLQCSCLENSRDGGAWWASVYGVAQSRTRLKWLSSSSSVKTDLHKCWMTERSLSHLYKISSWSTQVCTC